MKQISLPLQGTLINYYGCQTVLEQIENVMVNSRKSNLWEIFNASMHIERVQQHLAHRCERTEDVQVQILELEEIRSYISTNLLL